MCLSLRWISVRSSPYIVIRSYPFRTEYWNFDASTRGMDATMRKSGTGEVLRPKVETYGYFYPYGNDHVRTTI